VFDIHGEKNGPNFILLLRKSFEAIIVFSFFSFKRPVAFRPRLTTGLALSVI